MKIARSRSVGLLLVAASIFALIMSVYSSVRGRQFADCQSRVTEALILAQNARADAALMDRQTDQDEAAATAQLIRTVFTVQTSTERVAAYATYQKAVDAARARRAQTDADRAAHPLPAPPSQACG